MNSSGHMQLESLRFLLPTILGDVFRRWLDILLAGLIAVMGAYVWITWSWQPQYSTTACYAVMTKATSGYVTYSTSSVTYTVATTFKYLIDSDILQAEVADAMGVETLNGTISTELLEDTNILYLTVTSDSPEETYEIMNTVMDTYQALVDTVLGSLTLDVLEQPSVPTAPSNELDRTQTLVMAGGAAVAAVILLLALLSYQRDAIKTDIDFQEKLNIKRLATIPKERRKLTQGLRKKQKYLLINQYPISYQFTEAIEKLRASFEYRADKHDCKVILVTSTMANEGKSTVSMNLALSLAKTGSRVVFVDGDLRNPTTHSMLKLDKEIRGDLGEFLQGTCDFSDVIIQHHKPEMFLLVGRKKYDNAAELLGSHMMSVMVRELRNRADYIIIDTPPAGFMIDTEEVSSYADGVVLVVRQNDSPTKMVQDVLDSLEQTGIQVLGCVFNNVQAWGGAGSASYHEHSHHSRERS
ncbi:MAG: polysaccharide biosynthesis tyrosine autokinase [Clostridiales bacterium]|nr:polysaccharide biosynthesis tyrosine autokinase [Clostridiales bacterium]